MWNHKTAKEIPGSISIQPEIISLIESATSGLNLGCGFGRLEKILSGILPAKWTGIDISLDAITEARKQSPQHIKWIHGDTRTIEVNEKYDIVIAVALLTCLHKRSDRLETLKTALKHLTPRGTLVVSDFLQDPRLEIYRRRYKDGIQRGLEDGSFWVEPRNGAPGNYFAHHTTVIEFAQIINDAQGRLIYFRECEYQTSEGDHIAGFCAQIASATREP